MSDNVVLFPKQKKDSPPNSMDQVYQTALESRQEHIEYILDEVLSDLFNYVRESGFDVGKDSCVHSTGMLVEALRSALCQSAGISHPLQHVAKDMFDQKYDVEFYNELMATVDEPTANTEFDI